MADSTTPSPSARADDRPDGAMQAQPSLSAFDDALLAVVLDALPFYVMLVDEDHHILLANRAVRDQLGLDPKAVVGTYCPQAVHGCDGPYPGCPLEDATRTGEQTVVTEFFEEASQAWVESAVYETPLRTDSGKRVFFHMVRDISQRKHAEEEADRLHRELNDALAKVLGGFIPICMHCKQIRADSDEWQPVERYVAERTEAVFSHGICPRCLEQHHDARPRKLDDTD